MHKVNENFKTSIEELSDIQNWYFKYDEISDILYLNRIEGKIENNSLLIASSDDYMSARINRDGKIQAIVVDDFMTAFVKDNKEFQPFAKKFISELKKNKQVKLNTYQILSKALAFNYLTPKVTCELSIV